MDAELVWPFAPKIQHHNPEYTWHAEVNVFCSFTCYSFSPSLGCRLGAIKAYLLVIGLAYCQISCWFLFMSFWQFITYIVKHLLLLSYDYIFWDKIWVKFLISLNMYIKKISKSSLKHVAFYMKEIIALSYH
jgi:hypothetical protein